MNCIYCKNEISSENASNEHVFPEAFGCPNDWLLDCVCRLCNNEFGRTIERFLASDSIEGIWRLQVLGSRSKKHIKQTCIKINIPDEERYGGFRGAIVYADFRVKDSLYLPAQVLIIDENEKRKFTLLEKMTDDDIKNFTTRFELIAQNKEEYESATTRLRRLGKKLEEPIVGLPSTALSKDGKLEIEVEGVMNAEIFRAIAKISFNYLAKVKGSCYALDSKFDSLREFIRTGQRQLNYKPVTIEAGHVLRDETPRKYAFEGHLFTIESRNDDIIGKVVLTNMYNYYYVVKLGNLGLIWHDVKSGHAYSVKEKKISPLFSATFFELASRLSRPIRQL